MTVLTGKCLCAAVSYQITGPLGPIFNCHCSKCRRWHSAAFRTRTSVHRDSFQWVTGESNIGHYYSSEYVMKSFCKTCGSNLISTYDNNPEAIGLPIGGLDQDPGKGPEAHIFVKYKAPWHRITDDLPQHDEWPPNGAQAVHPTSE